MITRDIEYVLRRGVAEIIVERELRQRLTEGTPLRLKMGFDPSRPNLHIGHAVALRKLRQLQELGHQLILIVGDWTARIGDPTGQSETRVMLSEEQVNANAQSYMRQFFKIVDKDKTQVVFQSEWFGKFNLADVINLTSRFTVAQMLAREDFAQRYAAHKPIAITEFLYPLLQGYDSVSIRSDVEFGAMDQKFNCLVGRDLQEMMGERPQQVFLVPLLVGTDGRKMSQSYGNTVDFETPPNDMYGKIMSIPDAVMMDYLELLTDVPDVELAEYRQLLASNGINPIEVKHRLAREIVAQFHSADAARNAEAEFRRVVQGREAPRDFPEFDIQKAVQQGIATKGGQPITQGQPHQYYKVDMRDLLVLTGLVLSKGEAARLIKQGAVELPGPGVLVSDGPYVQLLTHGDVIRVGRRRYVRIVDSNLKANV